MTNMCCLMPWTPAFTDWLFSLFFFCLPTQAMQVKVQVKCMTCLFCPSIRGTRLWPPSALWSPWGWYRMDLPTWRSPRPAPGKTPARQRVNVGLPTLGMGKPGKPAKPHPNRGLLAISAPFPSCPLCSQHTDRDRGADRAWEPRRVTPLLCHAGSDSYVPSAAWVLSNYTSLPLVQSSHDSKSFPRINLQDLKSDNHVFLHKICIWWNKPWVYFQWPIQIITWKYFSLFINVHLLPLSQAPCPKLCGRGKDMGRNQAHAALG